jgi:non-heme chloroperoxidase
LPYASYACVDSWLTDFRGDLPKIDVPTLVHGTEDRILPYSATAQRLPALVADLRLVTVEGGPHNIAWTPPRRGQQAAARVPRRLKAMTIGGRLA